MPRPTQLSKEAPSPRETERRQAILTAARDLVAQVGFRDAQMTTIAEQAKVALGTLYRYFPSKTGLMVEVVHLVSQRELDAATAAGKGGGRPVQRVAAVAWTFASRALRGRKMAHALLAEAIDPEIETVRRGYARKLARVLEAIIEQGIRAGDFPAQDVQAAAACIVGSLIEGLIGSLALESRASLDKRLEQTRAIVAFCLRGISGKAGASALAAELALPG